MTDRSTASDALARALDGDINAFYDLYAQFRDELKSYLYRLVADRADAEDLAQDAFVRAFDKLSSFEQRSSLKTWVFAIATRLAWDTLRHRKRWPADILDLAKAEASAHATVRDYLERVARVSPHGTFEIAEHVNFCFTCVSKTLPLEQQVALLLRDVYRFSTVEVAQIMDAGEGAVKHYVRDARFTMARVFDDRCALVRQDGPCHQCSELNGWLNPRLAAQVEVVALGELRAARHASRTRLLELREGLVQALDPLRGHGADLHEAFFSLHRLCSGEVTALKPIAPLPAPSGTSTRAIDPDHRSRRERPS